MAKASMDVFLQSLRFFSPIAPKGRGPSTRPRLFLHGCFGLIVPSAGTKAAQLHM
jgi:hypothetical protein